MKKTVITLLAVFVLGLSSIQANATTITLGFDDIGQGTISQNYGGLDWDQRWNVWDSAFSSYYPPKSNPNVLYSHNASLVTKFGSNVTFLGSWIASVNAGQSLWWEGYVNGVKIFESAHLAGGTTQFLSLNWAGVNEVRYVTSGTNQYSIIDDFTYSTDGPSAPVPEPSTFILLGIGIAGAVLVRRRKK